ncbi:FAD-dependent oxidoreductase [Allosalinactinospora lopnorensis]|uniref:FAD-dependent oxidoreductase n=1 Tax=Allosalinactinospora lopnorensis TaxID=1352348 RepID=UPI000623C123|nr:FAD-binding protein [Allosalinactinospora lopnorensis]
MGGADDHAVVLGAGMAGLLAARVLADTYERVTLVERDRLPTTSEHRGGVPQGKHTHGMLPRGSQALDELFPGLLSDLAAGGAPVVHDYREFPFAPSGQLLSTDMQPGVPTYLATRPYLEHHIRTRVRTVPNITIADQYDVVDLVTTETRDRVTGVRVRHRADGSEEEVFAADLVVDAMGRGARTPAWLAELGYERPQEEELVVKVAYVTEPLRLQPNALQEKSIIVGATPDRPTGGALIRQENDTWLFTTYGCVDHDPPADFDARVAFAAEFLPPHAIEAIRNAERLDTVSMFKFPANRWRRYDRLRRFPEGLLVVGDALCSFNPIYGQGMSLAGLEALALRDCLKHSKHNLPHRFFRAAATPIGVAWQSAAAADLALPGVEGSQPLSMRVLAPYLRRLQAEASHDAVLATQFIRVAFLLDPPARLLRPAIMLRVLTAGWRRPAASTVTDSTSGAILHK